MFLVPLCWVLAATPPSYPPEPRHLWLDPTISAAHREDFEFDPMFNHERARPPYVLRIFHEHPDYAAHPERLPPKLLLGDLLFHAPGLLGPGAKFFGMSCDSCHPNGAATRDIWVGNQSSRAGTIDLMSDYFSSLADDGISNARRVPSLRGARYTAPYGHAGSVGSLGDFVDHVVSVELVQPPLRRDFRDALVMYIEQLDFLPDPYLDDLGRLNAKAPAEARQGEALFNQPRPQLDGLSCASCHVPESFFTDRRTHAFNHGRDAAPGEGFDTPSLLNLDEHAPYFFDASAPSLAAAVEQMNRKHQLGLTRAEEGELEAYLSAVGATSAAPSVPTTAERISHALAYLKLVEAGPLANDRDLWPLCLETVDHLVRGALRDANRADSRALGPPVAALTAFVHATAAGGPDSTARAELMRLARQIADRVASTPDATRAKAASPHLEPASYAPEPQDAQSR